ncbi:hypothetical protein HON59_01040 [bacterium]|jgi:hypothetical protein|nr:hypothetical protein [bacterium]MBT3730073.1 hypothetical protein [bacterium]MBT4894637.1 hypothetical protein [bacterium]
MKSIIDSYKKTGNLHHAYALEGDRKTAISNLYNFFENDLKIETKANLDFYFNEFESFGIDNGRDLQMQASRKAMRGNMQIFVIAFSSITSEAQNALLKLFEEPAKGVHFFIITSSSEMFLPTLKSRFEIIKLKSILDDDRALANDFIKASKNNRIKLLQDIIENKDKEQSLEFLNNLETILYKNIKDSPLCLKDVEVFGAIQKSRDYIRGRSPSVKMILENMALNV